MMLTFFGLVNPANHIHIKKRLTCEILNAAKFSGVQNHDESGDEVGGRTRVMRAKPSFSNKQVIKFLRISLYYIYSSTFNTTSGRKSSSSHAFVKNSTQCLVWFSSNVYIFLSAETCSFTSSVSVQSLSKAQNNIFGVYIQLSFNGFCIWSFSHISNFTSLQDRSIKDIVRRPLKEAFLASKIVILDYFSRELLFKRGEIDNSRLS